MNARHRAREIALQILYQYDLRKENEGIAPPDAAHVASDLNKHFEHFKVEAELREFAALLVSGTLLNQSSIDLKLEAAAQNWKLSRMPVIDRNLLRMALFELEKVKEIPVTVTLDEAVELAKKFCEANSPAFINGVLDSVKKTLPAEKPVR